jgi:trimeric autotransporter adhesin
MALTITELFDDATTREIGGLGPDQVNTIVSDLVGVQQGLNAAFPQVTDLTSLHAQIISNQLNEEIASVENANSPTGTPILGTDLGQYVGRAINDIHRDIIDIAQGDPGLQAVFNPTPLPALNTPATPFHDDATQTAFMTQFIQDSNHLGQAAVTIANGGFQADSAALVQQIQTFAQNANAFDQSEGGLWSARFWNELRSDGTAGVAASALVEGLQTHNAGEVNAAAQQLAGNAADVGSNNLMADGGNYAGVIAAAEATAVTPTAGQGSAGAGGTPQDPGAGGSAQGSGTGGSAQGSGTGGATQGSGAGGSAQGSGSGGSAQGSGAAGGSSQDPGNDGDHGNGQGSSGWHHHQFLNQNVADFSPQQGANPPSAANGQPHGNSPDFLAAADPTQAVDMQDHAQALHLHFAHAWTA